MWTILKGGFVEHALELILDWQCHILVDSCNFPGLTSFNKIMLAFSTGSVRNGCTFVWNRQNENHIHMYVSIARFDNDC